MNKKFFLCGIAAVIILISIAFYCTPIHKSLRTISAGESIDTSAVQAPLYAGISAQTYQYNHGIATGEIPIEVPPFLKKMFTLSCKVTVHGQAMPPGLENGA